jgi:hypothetical protein
MAESARDRLRPGAAFTFDSDSDFCPVAAANASGGGVVAHLADDATSRTFSATLKPATDVRWVAFGALPFKQTVRVR